MHFLHLSYLQMKCLKPHNGHNMSV